jgi:RHS repeat-associated protein
MQTTFNYDCSPNFAHWYVLSESRYTGKERDTESGNDYFGARYYASSMGRFMSPDWSSDPEAVPYADLGNPQSLNLYGYVNNNPLHVTDPDGHSHLECVSFTIIGGVSIELESGKFSVRVSPDLAPIGGRIVRWPSLSIDPRASSWSGSCLPPFGCQRGVCRG